MATIAAIVPTTGREMAGEALDSILHQTSPVDEIVVVFDTPEEPRDGLLGLPPADAKTVWTGGSSNPCTARNLGARCSSSEYLAFLDDDDYWLENHIEVVQSTLGAHPADVLCTSFWEREGEVLRPGLSAPERLEFRAFFCRNPGLRGSNLVIRASTFGRVGGFDPTFPAMNDLDIGIRLADIDVPFTGIAERTVVFRQHDGPRLSMPGSAANREGLLAFWGRYAERMSPLERETYAEWVGRFWGFTDFMDVVGERRA